MCILVCIAFWCLPLPLWLKITTTVVASINVLDVIARAMDNDL